MERKRGLWIATTARHAWHAGMASGWTRRGDANLALDGRQGQLWEGAGGGFGEVGWQALAELRGADRNRILDALFDREDGCRLNLGRLPIGASASAAGWYSHDEVDGDLAMKHFSIARDRRHLIPYLRAALQRQARLKLCAVPWSPPAWMKDSRAGERGRLLWKPEILDAYARYLARFVRAYQREGLEIHQLQVQDSPAPGARAPACEWTGAQLRDFIRGYLGPTFRRERLRTGIWLGTLNSDDYEGYTQTCLSDPMARQFLSGVGHHSVALGAVARIPANWPDVRVHQVAGGDGDGGNTWAQARRTFGSLLQGIRQGASAVCHANLVLRSGGLSAWASRQNSLVTVDPDARTWQLTPEYHALRHIAQCIDREAICLGLSGAWESQAAAFLNPDDSRVVLVQNPLPAAQRLVFADGDRLVTALLPADSFNSIVL